MNDETRTQSGPPLFGSPAPTPDAGATSNGRTTPDPSGDVAATVAQPTAAETRANAGSVADQFDVTVAGYEIVGELGRGAMGVVYRARHTKLNRPVALKMALGGRVGEKDLIRFLAEAEAVASIKHGNVVQVYDYGESDGRPYMALELCPGGSLAERLRDGTPFNPHGAAAVVARIATGVAAAHDEGIVHRDLKPGNVLLAADGAPKVADFGLAKRAASDLTATQAVMGTPSYMSPEQAGGKTKFVGPPADVWALGVILYECLAGARPFPGTTTDEVLAQVLAADPASVRTLAANVPRDLELICRTCLEKNPTDRYPTARELADDLGRFARGEPISVRPLGAAARTARWARRNPVLAGLLAAVAVVSLGLFASLAAQYRQALAQADAERQAKEGAERERQSAVIARQSAESAQQSAERAAQETARREDAERQRAKAELLVTRSTAEAAQANVLVELLNDLFRTSDPLAGFFGDSVPGLPSASANEGQAAMLGPFLRNAADRFRVSLADPAVALVRAKLLASIGNGMKNLGMFAEARAVLSEALALRRANLPDTDPVVWRSELDLGRLETEGGDVLKGLDRFRAVLAMQQRANAPPEAILDTRLYLGITLTTAGLAEADPVLRAVVREREKLNGKAHKDTLLAKLALIAWLLEKQKWSEIVTLFGEIRQAVRALPEARIRDIFEVVLDCQAKLAMANVAAAPGSLLAGSLRGAVAGIRTDIGRLEKVLPDDHTITVIFRFELAKLLLHQGETAEADALLARVLADARKTTGLAHPKMLVLLEVYAARLAATKRAGDARALFAEADKAIRDRFGAENPWRTALLLQRATFEQKQGEGERALADANEAIGLLNRGKFLPTPGSVFDLFVTAQALGSSPAKASRTAARELFAALHPLVDRVHGAASEEAVLVATAEGKLLYNTGDRVGAAATFARAGALLAGLPKLDPFDRVILLQWQGRTALEQGQFDEAEAHFRDVCEAAKKVPGYSDREGDTLNLARAVAAQGRYRDAIPLFEEARKLTAGRNADQRQLSFADMQVATAQLAAGDTAAYRKSCAAMFERYGRSNDVDVLSRLAWAGGVGMPAGWEPVAFAARFGAGFQPNTNYPWGYRGLALVRVRAGQLADVEAALKRAGPAVHPVDHLIRGLVAVEQNDLTTARKNLSDADNQIAAEKPSAKNPFAYAGRFWHMDLEVAVLRAELTAALAPPLAPPPRGVGR